MFRFYLSYKSNSSANSASGDPFNQTSADNSEWLERFKRDVGILKDVGPGLEGDPSFEMPDPPVI